MGSCSRTPGEAALGEQPLQQLHRDRLGPARGGNGGLHLPGPAPVERIGGQVLAPVERGDGDPGLQPVDLDVAQHEALLPALPPQRQADQLAHRAVPAVAPDDVVGAHDLGWAGGAPERRRDGTLVLCQGHQLAAQLHGSAERGEPVPQQLLRPPLREDDEVGVRDAGARRSRRDRQVGDQPAPGVQAQPVGPAAGREHLLRDPQVVEDLQGPRLEALAAGPPVERDRAVDDAAADPAPEQVAGEGQAGRAGSHDEHLDVGGPHAGLPRFSVLASSPWHPEGGPRTGRIAGSRAGVQRALGGPVLLLPRSR
nr:hypothetical protein [Modestobacter marinus]